VVAAGPGRPKTATDPQQWVLQTPPKPPVTPRQGGIPLPRERRPL